MAKVVRRAQNRDVNKSQNAQSKPAANAEPDADDAPVPAADATTNEHRATAGDSLSARAPAVDPLLDEGAATDPDSPAADDALAGAELTVATSPADLERSFDLRWRVLRAPWQQPRGSERDDREEESIHVMMRAAGGDALAVGRLHLNTPAEAQIRFMAVDPRVQGRGLGSVVLQELEKRARAAGATRIVLNARAAAQDFYKRHGYHTTGPAERLFAAVDHWRMRKDL